MNKKQLQSEQTRKRIVDAARMLFAQKGYKATSIEDIIAATGTSKGNLYYHFKSKEGLFLYLLDEWDREWEEKWETGESQFKTSSEKLFGLAELLVHDDLNHPLTKAADEFFNEEKTSEIEERITGMVDRHLEWNRRLIQEGIDRGEYRAEQAGEYAVVLESLLFGLSHMSRNREPEAVLELYHQAMKVFLYGISAGTTSHTPG
ncbi:TetR family transcriptional regulator [Paenibacillus antibioticophila]|uniref:TetR family transcriptional regulator n=1 Tax=Paenibacillus antibioticophila TaxID=1274374 RepID=A0A919XVJ4_9BACL|nr:TetR/AcrR family transcriptional regulator [Paenibacillus antibioticophila]GIO37665.1 TetR family transcriptional regulator [Paenibacillus antibioticophila]